MLPVNICLKILNQYQVTIKTNKRKKLLNCKTKYHHSLADQMYIKMIIRWEKLTLWPSVFSFSSLIPHSWRRTCISSGIQVYLKSSFPPFCTLQLRLPNDVSCLSIWWQRIRRFLALNDIEVIFAMRQFLPHLSLPQCYNIAT